MRNVNNIAASILCATAVASFGAQADAKGCIKGAIVGGIAGHYAGHGVVGAMGGCAVGRHLANKKARDAAAADQRKAVAPR